MNTGRPSRSAIRSRIGTSTIGRLTELIARPRSRSIVLGIPRPIASTSGHGVERPPQLALERRRAARRASRPWVGSVLAMKDFVALRRRPRSPSSCLPDRRRSPPSRNGAYAGVIEGACSIDSSCPIQGMNRLSASSERSRPSTTCTGRGRGCATASASPTSPGSSGKFGRGGGGEEQAAEGRLGFAATSARSWRRVAKWVGDLRPRLDRAQLRSPSRSRRRSRRESSPTASARSSTATRSWRSARRRSSCWAPTCAPDDFAGPAEAGGRELPRRRHQRQGRPTPTATTAPTARTRSC